MTSVSGVFRNVLTQNVPKPRSTGIGETRIAASSTPNTREMPVDAPVSLRIHTSVASQAALYRPSAAAAFRISLILSQLDLSSFFRPMPYGSVLNGLPTTLSLPANCDCAAYPARMMSSVVTASTEPWASASTHLEYESNSCRAAFGCSVWIRLAGVEPVTEQTFLPSREYGPVKLTFFLRSSLMV